MDIPRNKMLPYCTIDNNTRLAFSIVESTEDVVFFCYQEEFSLDEAFKGLKDSSGLDIILKCNSDAKFHLLEKLKASLFF